MAMDMEKLSLIVIHPVVGTTADSQGLMNIVRAYHEDKVMIGDRSVEGLRITKNYKDPNCILTVTALTGSDLDAKLSRTLLYPKRFAEGGVTWTDKRVDNNIKGGTGIVESIVQTSLDSTADTQEYTIYVSKYVGS